MTVRVGIQLTRFSVAHVTTRLSGVHKREIPFALSVAINDVFETAKEALHKETRRAFDRPRPYILNDNTWQIKRAHRKKLNGYIEPSEKLKPIFAVQTYGDEHYVRGPIPVPGITVKLNQYGDTLNTGQYGALIRGTDTYFDPKARRLYRRINVAGGPNRRELLYVLAQPKTYKPIFKYSDVMKKHVRKESIPAARRAIAHTLSTSFNRA